MRHFHLAALSCLTCVLSCSVSVFAQDDTRNRDSLEFQKRLLLNPTPGQLAAEQDGRVQIYDSLDIGLVDEAMDLHFNRIENMMFIRIHHLPPAGAGPTVVENDGCD